WKALGCARSPEPAMHVSAGSAVSSRVNVPTGTPCVSETRNRAFVGIFHSTGVGSYARSAHPETRLRRATAIGATRIQPILDTKFVMCGSAQAQARLRFQAERSAVRPFYKRG